MKENDLSKPPQKINKAEFYDKLVHITTPGYLFLQDQVLDLISYHNPNPRMVFDLGAGTGKLLKKILDRYPQAQTLWIDNSEEFLELARNRLAPYSDRVTYLLMPLEEDWECHLDSSPDVILSMLTIHHLETAEKRDIYRRSYQILEKDGWFFNIDEMKTFYPDAHQAALTFWLHHIENCEDQIPPDSKAYYEHILSILPRWKELDIDQPDRRRSKTAGDDLHDALVLQLEWLKDSGFKSVDLFFKFHLWCLIGGQKPG